MIHLVREGAAADAVFVAAALAGDSQAFASLFDGWFDRCFDVAFRILRNRDIAAEVAQDVFLGAWRDLGSLHDHTAFGGWVLRSSRNRALNRLERERRTVALGDEVTSTAVDAASPGPDAAADALSGTGADLVWAASAALGERDASILDLHLRHGLAAPELAEALGVTPNNAHQMLYRLRGNLGEAIRSFVLWHHGRPSCPELQDTLHRAGLGAFGPEAAKMAKRHASECDRCGERQRSTLAPEALFAGVPLLVAGPQLRAKVISSLRDAGVTMGEDPAAPPSSDPTSSPPGADLPTGDGAGADAEQEVEEPGARRRGVLIATLLALLLLAGATVLALGKDNQSTELASASASSSTTMDLAPATSGTDPAVPVPTDPPSTVTAPTGPSSTASPLTAVTAVTAMTPAPKSTTTVTAARTTTTAAAAKPVVVRFTATSVPPRLCKPNDLQVQLAWSTTNATAVTLAGPGAPAGSQSPSGTAVACASGTTASSRPPGRGAPPRPRRRHERPAAGAPHPEHSPARRPLRLSKLLGLAGVAGVAATGAVIARGERRRRHYEPDDVRTRLHQRHAEAMNASAEAEAEADHKAEPDPPADEAPERPKRSWRPWRRPPRTRRRQTR